MLNDPQAERIWAKPPLKRYAYFMETVVREEAVWGLSDEEGWLLLDVATEPPASAFIAFPQEQFADVFCQQLGLENMQPAPIDLVEFVEWLDDLQQQDIRMAVFPTANLESTVVEAAQLKRDVSEALQRAAE